MAEAKKTRLTYQEMVDLVRRGETVVLEDGTRARSVADLPPESPAPLEHIPIITPPQGQTPPPPPQKDSEDDGLDKLTKADLMAIAAKEDSEPKQGTNDEIRDGIRAKRKEATP